MGKVTLVTNVHNGLFRFDYELGEMVEVVPFARTVSRFSLLTAVLGILSTARLLVIDAEDHFADCQRTQLPRSLKVL